MTNPTGADILVDCLARQGVRDIFGMPGSHSTDIYDAIVRHGQLRTILVRNEQAGAFMADGYARVTGRPGVLCTTAGPGATNALTGIAEAWADSMPVLLIAGQVNHDRLHQECGNYHEIDLENIFRPCTKYTATLMHRDDIPRLVAEAFSAMTGGRPRPAALFLPQDLMKATAPGILTPFPSANLAAIPPCPADLLTRATELLSRAKKPLLLAGGGAVASGAAEPLRELARKLDCPIVTTLNGKGIVDERDGQSLGHARSARGAIALHEADLVLAIGCRFTEVFTNFRRMCLPADLLQIDIDPTQIGMNYPVKMGLVGDARDILSALATTLVGPVASAWGECRRQARAAIASKPEWLIEILRAELPDNTPLFADACEMGYRMHTDYPAHAPRTFFYPSNYITLGWAFPAAVGAAVALADRTVVSFSGDGGFVMTMLELATAARYQLRVVVIVHNDSAFGAIRHIQRLKHNGRFVDTDLNNPDFVKVAEAFGVAGVRASTPDEFRAAVRVALGRAGPSLIEARDEWRNLRRH